MANEIARRRNDEIEHVEQEAWMQPAVDVYENSSEWLIVSDIPGVERDNLKLHLGDKELRIEARRGASVDKTLRTPFGGGNFRRVFQLPSGVNADQVTADLRQGVVSIHLPKSDAVKPRRIEVRAG